MKKKILACVLSLMLVFGSSALVFANAFAGDGADYVPITATSSPPSFQGNGSGGSWRPPPSAGGACGQANCICGLRPENQ